MTVGPPGDARDQLRAAYEIFVSAGAGRSPNARGSSARNGRTSPKRAAETQHALTGREAHIARLAGQGTSNTEIAAQLFISPATVAYHLRKVFATLSITSRSQLASALPGQPDPGPACQATGVAPTGSSELILPTQRVSRPSICALCRCRPVQGGARSGPR
jgi:DNA-binding CsgD family transcriptional regulator